MKPIGLTFRTALTISFAGISMLLYLAASLIILGFQTRHSRADLHLLLYSEAEGLAGYVASTGRMDYPELVGFEEETPLPIWLRVIQGSRVVASTPEMPVVPVPEADTGEGLNLVEAEGGALASVQHQVWNRPGLRVEALARREFLDQRLRELLLTLSLTGLILLPLSAAAGHLLARHALRPVQSLVASIACIDSRDLSRRLRVSGPVREISELAAEFNSLLERVESSVSNMQRFTANASHELRTPIASLRTGLEVILRRDRGPEEYRTLLVESLREIDRMQRVIEGLMALAREKASAAEPPREPVDLGEVARLSDRTMRPLAEEKDLRLTIRVAETAVVRGNADQLQLLLINLIDNAIRHSPGGSEICVDVGRRDGYGRMGVRDQGPGVPPEDRPHIFDRHYQGSQRPGERRLGGIGLDVVSWVAEVHRGSVRLVGEAGAGAEFEVLLPLAGALAGDRQARGLSG